MVMLLVQNQREDMLPQEANARIRVLLARNHEISVSFISIFTKRGYECIMYKPVMLNTDSFLNWFHTV